MGLSSSPDPQRTVSPTPAGDLPRPFIIAESKRRHHMPSIKSLYYHMLLLQLRTFSHLCTWIGPVSMTLHTLPLTPLLCCL